MRFSPPCRRPSVEKVISSSSSSIWLTNDSKCQLLRRNLWRESHWQQSSQIPSHQFVMWTCPLTFQFGLLPSKWRNLSSHRNPSFGQTARVQTMFSGILDLSSSIPDPWSPARNQADTHRKSHSNSFVAGDSRSWANCRFVHGMANYAALTSWHQGGNTLISQCA
jgi:hypothetical protein